jgi:hypothetical protein
MPPLDAGIWKRFVWVKTVYVKQYRVEEVVPKRELGNENTIKQQRLLADYQLSNLTLKLRAADTTLMYKLPLAALATLVQPPPVLVMPCVPEVML